MSSNDPDGNVLPGMSKDVIDRYAREVDRDYPGASPIRKKQYVANRIHNDFGVDIDLLTSDEKEQIEEERFYADSIAQTVRTSMEMVSQQSSSIFAWIAEDKKLVDAWNETRRKANDMGIRDKNAATSLITRTKLQIDSWKGKIADATIAGTPVPPEWAAEITRREAIIAVLEEAFTDDVMIGETTFKSGARLDHVIDNFPNGNIIDFWFPDSVTVISYNGEPSDFKDHLAIKKYIAAHYRADVENVMIAISAMFRMAMPPGIDAQAVPALDNIINDVTRLKTINNYPSSPVELVERSGNNFTDDDDDEYDEEED